MIDRAGRLAKRYSLYRLMTADSPVWTRFNDGHRCEQHGVLRVVSSRHTHFIRHGIRRDQMSLLQSNVNTTRYFADAPEAVGKTDESAPGDLPPPPQTARHVHNIAFWSPHSVSFTPNKLAQTVSGDVASKRP